MREGSDVEVSVKYERLRSGILPVGPGEHEGTWALTIREMASGSIPVQQNTIS